MNKRKKDVNVICLLEKRKLGLSSLGSNKFSNYRSSHGVLRQTMFSKERKWKIINKSDIKNNFKFYYDSILHTCCYKTRSREQNSNTGIWSDETPQQTSSCSMKRLVNVGKTIQVYSFSCKSHIKEAIIYGLPEPNIHSGSSKNSHKLSIILLMKNNSLRRHDLFTGQLYNEINLGEEKIQSLYWNTTQDQLITKAKSKTIGINHNHRNSCLSHITFKLFWLKTFQFDISFCFSSINFTEKKLYGKLMNADVEGSFVIVFTDSNYVLWYSMEHIREIVKISPSKQESATCPPVQIDEFPPILYAVKSYQGYSTVGGHPFMYIRASTSSKMEVCSFETNLAIKRGELMCDSIYEKGSLTFHVDDSNRVIFSDETDFKIYKIFHMNNESSLELEFDHVVCQATRDRQTPNKEKLAVTTRSGRRISRLIGSFVEVGIRALAYDFEDQLNFFVVLESDQQRLDTSYIPITGLVFYDTNTYEELHRLDLNLSVKGCYETTMFGVHVDLDVIHIWAKDKGATNCFTFRLGYKYEPELFQAR